MRAVHGLVVSALIAGCGGGAASGATDRDATRDDTALDSSIDDDATDATDAIDGASTDGVDALGDDGSNDGADANDTGTPYDPIVGELPDVTAWLGAHVPDPSTFDPTNPLVVVVAAGTNNRLDARDVHPAATSDDPFVDPPDTRGLGWWTSGGSGFQAGHLAIAALLRAGWSPCDIDSPKVRFVVWGYGTTTAGWDVYYRAPQDIGTDLHRVHSLGGSNAAIDGPFNGGLPAYSAVSLDDDAHHLGDAIDAHAKSLGGHPRVLLVSHSWGAAYASYFVDRYYSNAKAPSYDLVAAVLAAAPARVVSRPFAFGVTNPSPCPKYLDYTVQTTSCNVRDCLTISGSASTAKGRAFCDLGAHTDAVRSTPTYSFERPDDPIPGADPTTVYRAWQSSQGTYPGIDGHDYMVRTNESYDVRPWYRWSGAANGATCDPSKLSPVDAIVGAGSEKLRGIWGIDTAFVSCAINAGTHVWYAGSCNDTSHVDTDDTGLARDAKCSDVVAGQQSDVRLASVSIDPSTGAPSKANRDALFVTKTKNGPTIATPAAVDDRRRRGGFIGCP